MRLAAVLIVLLLMVCTGCASHSRRGGARHVVRPGQTLYRIGKTYHVPVAAIMRRNHIKDPTRVKIGQILYIPGARYTRSVPVASSKKKTRKIAEKTHVKSVAKPKKKTAIAVKKKTTRSVAKKYVPVNSVAVKRGKFLWPVRGKLIKKFNLSGKVPSKGIDIAVPINRKVVSAAAGKVIYSGNGISGFGHVIIIEHDNSFYTVYGYNKKLLVGVGNYVSAGQNIATVGTPPGGKYGCLHFEVWRHKKAVNPALYLK